MELNSRTPGADAERAGDFVVGNRTPLGRQEFFKLLEFISPRAAFVLPAQAMQGFFQQRGRPARSKIRSGSSVSVGSAR